MKLTKPQQRIQAERNRIIFKLYNEGLGYTAIAEEMEKKYKIKLTRQRISQIVTDLGR